MYGGAWDGLYYWTLTDEGQVKCWDVSTWPAVEELPENGFSSPTSACRGLWFDGEYFWTAEGTDGFLGYIYRFDYDEMRFGKFLGALHAMEIPFVFGLEDGLGKVLYNEKNIGPAKELSRIIQGYWTNFAKTGDPNGGNDPEWPAYDAATDVTLVFDERGATAVPGFRAKVLDFLEAEYERGLGTLR